MTTLERMQKQRAEYLVKLQQVTVQGEQLKGAIQALDVQIAEESALNAEASDIAARYAGELNGSPPEVPVADAVR